MSTSVKMATLPDCNFCSHPGTPPKDKKPARFDFKTSEGPRAYACWDHYLEWRFFPVLGTGRGQLLLLEGETEAEVMAQLAS